MTYKTKGNDHDYFDDDNVSISVNYGENRQHHDTNEK